MNSRVLFLSLAAMLAVGALVSFEVAAASPVQRLALATATPAPITPAATSDPSPTSTPSAVVVSTYTVVAADGPAAFAEEQVTLTPVVGSPPAMTAAQAYTIAKSSAPLPYVADSSGPGTATMYLYSNSASGTINKDGSTTLEYQSTPAWVFSFPLSHDVGYSMGGAAPSSGQAFSVPTSRNCSWISIVDASRGELIEAFESCNG